jgi:putative addiction module killer protein
MTEIRQTPEFNKWLTGLRDRRAAARVQIRIDRLSLGLFGDVKPVGAGLSEFRVDYGPGYRVYFVQRGEVFILLLCGGDKRTQDSDIDRAKAMLKELSDGA